jgi:signal transduction histidine kinase
VRPLTEKFPTSNDGHATCFQAPIRALFAFGGLSAEEFSIAEKGSKCGRSRLPTMTRSHNDLVAVHSRIETEHSQPEGESHSDRKPGAVSVFKDEKVQSNSGPYRLAWAAAAISIVLGATVWVGWWLNLPNLQSVWPGHTQMTPNGGLVSLLLGAALLSKIQRSLPKVSRVAGDITALFAAALGFLTLLEYLLGWNTGVDQWIFKNQLAATRIPFPGRLSFPGAVNAFCLGLGIPLLDIRIKGVWLTQLFAVIAALIALLALIGYVCNVREFYGQLSGRRGTGMPPQAMLSLLLLGAGLLCARPERGLIAVLWSYTPGGMLARWLLLAPAAGLLLTGLVYLVLTHVIPVDRAVRTWAMGLANLFFVTVPIWGAAHALHKVGLERDRAHQELEDRVQQRTAELSEANLVLQAEIKERQHAEKALREARDRLERQAIELERRVEERTAKLAETVGDLEAFSYSVAHDMRAPLRGMQGFAHLLIEEHAPNLNSEARDYLHRIASSAARMDLLIQDALHYTQVLRSETELKPVELDRITRQLVSSFPGWQTPRAEINIIGTLPSVLGHEGFIVQCLSNLVGNAVKFVPSGATPRVRIWAELLETSVRLYIEDNGIGIASKDHDRIFRMFERINGAEEYEGTGIGLAIVRKAVERMKGQVDFESEPGRGTKFWMELKKAPSAS